MLSDKIKEESRKVMNMTVKDFEEISFEELDRLKTLKREVDVLSNALETALTFIGVLK